MINLILLPLCGLLRLTDGGFYRLPASNALLWLEPLDLLLEVMTTKSDHFIAYILGAIISI